ncbi:putative esterase of the alpha-beta hydrolase superfamily [Flavobacterium psychrophilum]|uniref:patatin-like phospholipase family protein n=1 Tax=Flavobacterium psychrophilum TaxID=96345 RepID=UPI000B7C4DA5|nr:patatin-like phospholipase family protein [Flavobacterium psychrophilum]SNB08761.1 putative esterase of the alpha-beta hydrolase superfamily [Flavobacterium psychrophilum]
MYKAHKQSIFPLFTPIFFFLKKKEKGFPLLSGLKGMRLLYLLTFCLTSLICFSQTQDSSRRLKIGLVLSGGGAKGFAHIGVLKEIERAGIKIDYIGGTSMGAIIGGLYASGYNASQLDSIFKETNFDELVQDFVPRKNKTFYEKSNDELYALSLPFQKFKITIPKGLSKGMYNYNLISKLTHNVRHVQDFSKLKIPFLCVATNLETGEEKVFKNGCLPLVLSASSAFPSLFSPVEIDGDLYVDGGVTNNYPVEEVRKMGADVIIGVDVQDDLKDRESLNSVLVILNQISNYQTIEKMREKKLQTDIYIKPNIEGFSVVSFDRGEQIVNKGIEAALLVREKLERLGTHYQETPENTKGIDSLHIQEIGIEGNENYTRSYVIGKLRFKPGSKISYSDLHNGINNLNATQNFSSLNYKLTKQDNQDNLIINVKENPVKTYFKLGVHYDDLFKSSALVNVTQRNLYFKNDVASLDVILGDAFRYNLDYYIDNGFHWSFGFKSKLNQFKRASETDFNDGKTLQNKGLENINIDYLDLSNQAYLQTIFAQKFLFGIGVEHKYINVTANLSANTRKYLDKNNYMSLIGFLKYDSFSNKYFPKRGWYFMGDIQSFLSSSNHYDDFTRFTSLKADVGIVQTVFKKVAVKLQTEGGFLVDTKTNTVFDYVLGGYGFTKINNLKPFYGYNYLDLSGNSYVKASLSFDYEFIKKNHLNLCSNFANIGNNIFDTNAWISSPKYTGYALGYGIETLVGPIEIKQSWSPETGKSFTWFTVGFVF